MDKCRELFEKFPCSAVPDQYKRVDGKYVYPAIQRDWEEFIRGWNASHDSCEKIIEGKAKLINTLKENAMAFDCMESIQNDKVKL